MKVLAAILVTLEETGRFVVSSVGDEVAFIIFGACTTLPAS